MSPLWPTIRTDRLELVLYFVVHLLYSIFFHPLARFPGPRHLAISQVPIAAQSWNGTLHTWLRDLHDMYGSDVVRVSPRELSIISPSAWKDIYSNRPGHANFPKDRVVFGGRNSILTANDTDHSRMRRLLSHAFSEKAIREQEHLIESHTKVLVDSLKRAAKVSAGAKVNMVDWCQWVSFDIIGDLAFGEPFQCLVDARYTPWVEKLIQGFKAVAKISVAVRFRLLTGLLSLYLFRSQMVKDSIEHARLSKEKLQRRMLKAESRPDFVSYILTHNADGKGMSQIEVERQSSVFINAGSQTVGTFLCGAVWFMLQNPGYVSTIRSEMESFERGEGKISLQHVGRLKHFQAFVSECHRMYPGSLAGLPRSSGPPGDTAGAFFIPGHTGVHLNQYAAYRSHRNFRDPDDFRPERWLGDLRYELDRRDVLQPFAMGPRNCIGKKLANAEIALILSRLILNFDFASCEETDLTWLDQKAWFGWEKKPLILSISLRRH